MMVRYRIVVQHSITSCYKLSNTQFLYTINYNAISHDILLTHKLLNKLQTSLSINNNSCLNDSNRMDQEPMHLSLYGQSRQPIITHLIFQRISDEICSSKHDGLRIVAHYNRHKERYSVYDTKQLYNT